MRSLSFILSRFCIPIILLISLWVSSNLKWSEQGRRYTISSDGKGYYAYLPAVLIYQDLHFTFFDSIEAKYYDEHVKYDYRAKVNGIIIDKYFAGVAVLQLPFFLIAHGISLISDELANGYTKWYIILMCIGAIFWLGIGLYYLRKFLRLHNATEAQSAFILFVIFFGTNLFYYTICEPMMSHVYSFSLVSMFLCFGKNWIDTHNKMAAVKAGLLLGIIILVRPVNILIAFWLIYEAGGFMNYFKVKLEFLKSFRYSIPALALFLLPIALQLFIWKIQTGNWFVDSYGDEAFHFTQLHIIEFLFSYKKGLFVYLPLTFIALFGLIPLWKKDRFRATFAGLYFLFVVYILSCWWMWYYGGSFGTRVIVEYLPLFALLLYYLLNRLRKKPIRVAVISVVIIVALFCQFQTYQYRYELIHWSEMTKDKYWSVFGKIPGEK